MADLLQILKKMRDGALGSPSRVQTSTRQEQLLRMFAAAMRNQDIVRLEPWKLEGLIRGAGAGKLSGLTLLVHIDHDDRYSLRDMYLAFANLAAEGSSDLLQAVQEEIRASARNPGEDLTVALRDLENLREKHSNLLSFGQREPLEVDVDFSPEQLKIKLPSAGLDVASGQTSIKGS